MLGSVLVCGGVFTHDRLDFVRLLQLDKDFNVHVVTDKDLLKPRLKVAGDYLILLGLKKTERLLRKQRLETKEIISRIWTFCEKVIPAKIPLIVLDDWTLPTLELVGNKLRKHLFKNFNVRKYLLREYLTTEQYPKEVVSFTIPANDHTDLSIPANDKVTDFFFQGNLSDQDRSVLFSKVKKRTRNYNCVYKTMTGGVKNTKDRLPFDAFLKTIASSKMCLHFKGTGYDCYRYQEIPSVGSIIVTPRYPWLVRNDYEDMKSCVVYSGGKELKQKIDTIMGSSQLLAEMQSNSIERFKKYHTSDVRYQEFKQFVNDAIRRD